jgi:hypothetical protein
MYARGFSQETNGVRQVPLGVAFSRTTPSLVAGITDLPYTRNSRFSSPGIVRQINKAFGLNIGKDVVRRVLA